MNKIVLAVTPAPTHEDGWEWEFTFILHQGEVRHYVQGHPDNVGWIDGYLTAAMDYAPLTMVQRINISRLDPFDDPKTNPAWLEDEIARRVVGVEPGEYEMMIKGKGEDRPHLQELKIDHWYWEVEKKFDLFTVKWVHYKNRLVQYTGFGFFDSKENVNIELEGHYLQEV